MIEFKPLIDNFFDYIQDNSIEIYNEFSLQHELGIFLRKNLPGYIVQFERNISYFGINTETIKKEIDIVIFNKDKSEKYAIELKNPRNGQYPEQMYSFVKDIRFMEELVERGFDKTVCVTLVSDRPFYEGQNNSGIYKYFREEYLVYGNILKPTGKKKEDEYISLSWRYDINWQKTGENSMYYVIDIADGI